MSRLNELIRELCPDGVEFKKLGVICEIKTGKGITKADAINGGPFPIISGGNIQWVIIMSGIDMQIL